MRRWRKFPPSPRATRRCAINSGGESAGGPFWKDHSFWFENFEKQQFKIATGFQGTEPSAAYQAQALPLLAFYGVPQNSATTNLLAVLWPADSLTGPATSPNFLPPAPETGYSYDGVIKLDHNFNQPQSLSARAFIGQGNQIAPVCNCQPGHEYRHHRRE